MSDTRKREKPSLSGLQEILDQAIVVLRDDGFPDAAIQRLLDDPVSPRAQRIEFPTMSREDFERAVDEARFGNAFAKYRVPLEICAWLRQKAALPPKVQDYLLSAIEGHDAHALGWIGPRNRDPIKEGQYKWARAVLVYFLASGERTRESEALRRVKEVCGYSSAKKLVENCKPQMDELQLWDAQRWATATLALKACRMLMEEVEP